MNALNILSGIGATPPPSPPRSRTSSSSNILNLRRSSKDKEGSSLSSEVPSERVHGHDEHKAGVMGASDATVDEKATPQEQYHPGSLSRYWRLPRRIAEAAIASCKALLVTVAAPARYLVACLYDQQGNFSVMIPIRNMFRSGPRASSHVHPASPSRETEEKDAYYEKPRVRPKDEIQHEPDPADDSTSSPAIKSRPTTQADSESEKAVVTDPEDSPARNTRSKSAPKDEIAPAKKSIRIKLHNEEALLRKRRHSRAAGSTASQEDRVAAMANSLKSPSSPASATKLKYPRAPAAPRPLVPRRQPSYTFTYSPETPKKTLIIDLDETLIHSMAKGGRMSTGHMVEVKFQGPVGGGGIVLGPQVPILYYVHERPYCHDFLRKVSLVSATARIPKVVF